MALKMRLAQASDYDGICLLSDQVDRLHRQQLPHIFKKPEGPTREWEYIQELLADPNTALIVAEIGDRWVGFVTITLFFTAEIPLLVPRRYAVINNLVVDEGYRRKGIARELMTQAEAWAVEKGASSVELSVYKFNRDAQMLYEKLGYEVYMYKMGKLLEDE
jgi:ribosomal protein S18 acetylase RimI-like enzyme